MVGSMPNSQAALAIFNIAQLEIEHFTRPQATMQHQQHHSLVTYMTKGVEQALDVVTRHRAGQPQYGFDAEHPPQWALATDTAQKGLMAIADRRWGRERLLLN